MRSVKTPRLGIRLLTVFVCTFGLVAWAPPAHGDDVGPVDCPWEGEAGRMCSCWREAGIVKMVCSQPMTGRTGSTTGTPSTTETSKRKTVNQRSASVSRPEVVLPTFEEPREVLNPEERRAMLVHRQRSLDEHLLKVQRARFLAKARGETPEEIEKLEETFAKLQEGRHQNLTELEAFDTSK